MKWLFLLLLCKPAFAEIIVPTRIIKAGEEILSADLNPLPGSQPGTYSNMADVLGKEANVILYPNRPIHLNHLREQTIISRNQIVTLNFSAGLLVITTEGRALARGGPGDIIPVLNLTSRTTIRGRIEPDGSVQVGFIEG